MEANNRSLIRAYQAHPVGERDREATAVAGLSKAGAVPQLDRALTGKGTFLESLPYEVPDALLMGRRTECLFPNVSY